MGFTGISQTGAASQGAVGKGGEKGEEGGELTYNQTAG